MGFLPVLGLGKTTPSKVPQPRCYLENPVKGPETPTLGWPIRAHAVDVDALFQEAVGDAETEVTPHGVLVQRHLGAAGGGALWSPDLPPASHSCPSPLGWHRMPLGLSPSPPGCPPNLWGPSVCSTQSPRKPQEQSSLTLLSSLPTSTSEQRLHRVPCALPASDTSHRPAHQRAQNPLKAIMGREVSFLLRTLFS